MSNTFTVEKREGKVKDPELCMGVVSGPDQESIGLQFNLKDFRKLLSEAGQSSLVTLEGLDKPVEVTIHNIERAPFTNEIHHVEFYAVKRGSEMNAEVQLSFVGEAPAVKLDATINKVIRSLHITCKPKDLIQEVEVDLSALKEIGDTINIKDLKVPSEITLNHEPDAAVVTALAPKQQKKEDSEEIVDAADVPVAGSEEGEESQSEEEKPE